MIQLLYIDPGTGSMLFTVLIGIAVAAVFSLRKFWVRLKFEDPEKEGNPDVMQGQELMAAIVLVLDICCIAFLYRTTIMVTMVLTTLSGIYLVLWLSTRLVYGRTAESGEGDSVLPEERSAGNRPGRAARLLEGLGLMSMDIYILHEPVVTALKLVFWNRLGWNYILCTILFFVLGVLIPIPVSRWLIRPVPLFRFLLFGEYRKKA